MTIVSVPKANTELSELLSRVEAGEEIILARDDKPLAKLVPVAPSTTTPRLPGRFAYLRNKLPPDLFLEPMSEDELEAWEGKYSFPGDNGQ